MKRFVYRLDRVARVRRVEQDRAQGEWAAARARQQAVEGRLQAVRDAATAEATGMRVGNGGDVTSLRATAFRAGLRAQAVVHAQEELVGARSTTDQAGLALREAARKVDALARLERHKREEWLQEHKREEARMTDDIVSTRAAIPGGRR